MMSVKNKPPIRKRSNKKNIKNKNINQFFFYDRFNKAHALELNCSLLNSNHILNYLRPTQYQSLFLAKPYEIELKNITELNNESVSVSLVVKSMDYISKVTIPIITTYVELDLIEQHLVLFDNHLYLGLNDKLVTSLQTSQIIFYIYLVFTSLLGGMSLATLLLFIFN